MEQKQNILNIFSSEYRKLVNYARKYITASGDKDPEDIVQDVALNLFTKVDFDSVVQNAAASVFGSLRNRITDQYRKGKRTVSIDDEQNGYLQDTLEYNEPNAGEALEKTESYELLYEAIGKLSEEQGSIIIETELEGRSFKEISEETGVPMGTLLSRKHRALANLKKIMNDLI